MRYEGAERRRYPRSKRGFPVVVDDGGPGVLNHVDNIGPNGVLCHTVKPVPLMTKMSIALHLPAMEGNRVECEGIVVRCEPDESGDDHFKVAILFMDIGEEIQRAILDYVEQDQDVPPEQDA